MDTESIETKFPLHWLVWNNSYEELQEKLKNETVNNTIMIFHKFIFVLIGVIKEFVLFGNLSYAKQLVVYRSISAGLTI